MPRISILMPCYNAADTLDDSLQSLAQQTWADFEVVVVDDGSSDATQSILLGWAKKDRRIIVLSQAHGGIIPALNRGLQTCQGDYIARMDADDRCLPQRLEKQARLLDEHPQVALVSCLVRGFPTTAVGEGFRIYLDWQNSLTQHEDICREIFVESPFAHPSVMLRKGWMERADGYHEHGWAEDYDLWLRLYLLGAHFAKVHEVLLEWRERPNRLTRQDSRYSLENFLRLKAHYLAQGPLCGRDGVIVWGAGMMGRRLGKQLEHIGAPLAAFIDIDPAKIGHTRRGHPVLAAEELPLLWQQFQNPVVLSAVGARGARLLIRRRLDGLGLVEGRDWWSVA